MNEMLMLPKVSIYMPPGGDGFPGMDGRMFSQMNDKLQAIPAVKGFAGTVHGGTRICLLEHLRRHHHGP